MLDDFLQSLFSPDSPATFQQRFEPVMMPGNAGQPMDDLLRMDGYKPLADNETMRVYNPDDVMRSLGGGALYEPTYIPQQHIQGDPLAPRNQGIIPPPPVEGNNVDEMSARAKQPSVPLPRARPDIESMLGGGAPQPTPSGTPAPAAPAGDQDMFSKLAGLFGNKQPGPTGDLSRDAASPLGKLFGMTPAQDRAFRASLAGGMAGGNPAFAGGAFMKGLSGGMAGGLKSEQQTRENDQEAAKEAQKQSNFERTQGDKEKTSEALRKLYGMRGAVMEQNAATRSANAGKTAWNKPASERWKDANRLIIDKEKQLKGAINPMLPKADRDAQAAAASAELDAFKRQTLKQYGFDENGQDTAPMQRKGGEVPSSGKVVGDKEATDQGLYPKGTYDDPAEPASQEEFDALPPGSYFKNPKDGQIMRKRDQ